MANTNNILAAFAIVFLTCLSLSSAFVKHDLDIPNALKKHETQTFLREKREKEVEAEYFNNNNPLELEEEVSEPTFVAYDKREAIGEEAKERGQKDDEKNEEQEKPNTRKTTSKSNNVEEEEEGAKDDVFSYRDMHDLIQALILADKEDIAERLQQLRENATKFEISSNLPKRQAIASTAAAAAAAAAASSASSDLLGTDLWDVVPLTDLDAHSCEVEAFSHGHSHVSGTIVHEFFCELRKLWHYGLIVLRNFKSELSLGPLIAGEVVTDGIFGHLFHHTSHLLHAVIREPHHLLILPDIIRDAVPFPSITGAIHRLKHVFFKVLDFVCDLVRGHVSHIFRHLFSHHHHHHHHHLGVRLREKLHHLEGFGSILPLEEMIAEPILPTAASATTATATATATASSDGPVIVSDYQRSLAEVLTGARSFFTSPIYSRMSSYLPFFNHFGCGPIQEATTTTSTVTTSSASSSVGIDSGSIVGPIVSPIAPIVAPVESEIASSSTASATATATATVAETPQPVISAGPTIVPLTTIPYESTSSTAAAATATATATAAASPVIESSSYQTVPQVYAPIVVEEIAVPAVLENNAVAATSAAASAAASTAASAAATSSAANVVPNPIVERVPLVSPLRRHRLRPGLSTVAPAAATAAAAAAATASASASSTQSGDGSLLEPARYRGLDLDIDRRIRYPSIRPRVSHVVTVPSSTASSAAAASASAGSQASSAVASSSASTVSSDGFNLVLPREQIVGALGYDYLLPGDVISVTLRNKSILFGRVLDTTSPITFTFLRPKVRASLLRHGGRVWNLLPRDFKDPECVRKFNNPLLLRYGL
ncbi:hypothetical protein P5V15_002000 [Pogonomyrmex californicus]